MFHGEDQWNSVVQQFSLAAVEDSWPEALEALADACGARYGQVVGLGADGSQFNWVPGVPSEAIAEWNRLGGHLPEINPRVAAGSRLPAMVAVHGVHCASDAEFRRSYAHADFCRRWDVPFGSQAVLMRNDELTIGLATMRGQSQEMPDIADRRAFEALMPVVRSAVMTQMAIEGRGDRFMSGALEALGVAAFICDRSGEVKAMTPEAETLIAAGFLRIVRRRLDIPDPAQGRRLAAAIEAALGGVPVLSTLLVGGANGGDIEVMDVAPLPRRSYTFTFEPRILVAVRSRRRGDAQFAAVLIAAYGLTATEASIAAALAQGKSREAIAAERQITSQTLKTHIKRIFAKLGINRESQLVARLQRFR